MLMCGHTFLYSPPVRAVKGMLDARRARRDLLRLLEPGQPRPAPARRQRRSGTSARTTSRSSCTGSTRCRRTVRAVGRDSIVPGIPDVAFVNLALPVGHRRQRRAELAGAEQAAPHRDRRQREDGRLRGRRAEPVRIFDHGVVYKDPETFGEYHLSYRTGDILSPKVDSYEPLVQELEDFVRGDPERGRDGRQRQPGARRRPPDRGRGRIAAAAAAPRSQSSPA